MDELVVLELVVDELVGELVLELVVDELLVVEPVVVDPPADEGVVVGPVVVGPVVVDSADLRVDEVVAAGLVVVDPVVVPVGAVVDGTGLLNGAANGPVTVMPTWTWPMMPPRPGVSASTWRRPSMSIEKLRSWFWPSRMVTLPPVGIQLS